LFDPVRKGLKNRNKRSQIAKKGINRWNQDLLKQVKARQNQIFEQLRWMRNKMDRLG
jgi:hypothetical protein